MPTGDPEDEARHKETMGPKKRAGRFDDIIEKHAKRVGLDPEYMKRVMKIESGGDPQNVTGRYHGLFQLDEKEFRAHGGSGSRFDPEQNTMAAANMFAKQQLAFKEKYGREMKPIDRYMIHQQGAAGYSAHLADPDQPAWKNVREYYGSDEMAKKAIWGNVPDKDKTKFGSVENVTSKQFVSDVWAPRVEGGEPEFGGTATAGWRSKTREGSNAKLDFLEASDRPKKKSSVINEGFEPINVQIPNLVPRFSIG